MTRIRTVKPAFFRSLTVAELEVTSRLTFIGLWTYVDDDGRGVDDVRLVKAELWPLDDRHTLKKVEGDLVDLVKHDHICRYEADGSRWLHVVNWPRHQKISHPQPPTKPPCPIHEPNGAVPDLFRNGSGTVPTANGAAPESSGIIPPGSGREGNKGSGSGNAGRPATPPGRRPAPEKPGSLAGSLATIEARLRAEATADECGRCDGGWVETDAGMVRCACQAAS